MCKLSSGCLMGLVLVVIRFAAIGYVVPSVIEIGIFTWWYVWVVVFG